MGTTDTSKTCVTPGGAKRVVAAAVAAAVLTATAAPAAEFEPQITAGITHTDNVALAAENNEESELIFSIAPSFLFSQESARITTNAEYRLQALRYRDLGENDVYHQYQANIRAALIPDNFFLEVGGSRSQSIVDPEQNIPQSNLPISSNRQDRDIYYAAPSFQYALGNNVAAAGEYRHSWVEYGETSDRGSEQGEARFSIDNYRAEQGVTWALRYNWDRTEYELGIPWENQRATAELGLWVGGNTRLFAAGGKESAWDMPLDSSLEDEFWEAGFSHQAGESLSAEFAVGERTFGSSWRGNLDFQFRRGSTTLSYTETPTTEGRTRLLRGAFDGPEVPDDFLSRPGSTERFIARRLQWTLNLQFRRSGLSFSLFDSDRTDRTEADGTPLDDESQRGANLTATYRVGARTDLSLGGSWAEREFREGDTSELTRAFVTAGYRLGSRTSLSLSYQYTEEDGESLTSIRDYVANMVSLYLSRTF